MIVVDKLLPMAGVIVGGLLTYITQSAIYKRNIQQEKYKYQREILIEKLEMYNEILKIEGYYVLEKMNGRFGLDFEFDIYKDNVRPVIFSKYHLLNKEMSNKIKEIDKCLASLIQFDDISKYDNDRALNEFYEFIRLIEKEIDNFRNESNII